MTRLVATVRDYAGLIEAFRAIKDHLQLSNATIDTLCGFTPGHTDKLLGPTCVRALSPLTFNGLAWCLALKIEVSLDMARVKEMAEHWEKRNGAQARALPSRISKVIVERAKPLVLQELSQRGNAARKLLLPGKEQREIAGKAARARARLPKAVRSEISRKGWLTRRGSTPRPRASASAGS